MIADAQIRKLLSLTWWAIAPPCALLVARFTYERACLDPYELLRPVMQHQTGALLVASLYAAAHVWLIAAIIMTVRGRTADSPWLTVTHDVWKRDWWKLVAMAAIIAIEQVPRVAWTRIYAGFCT